MKNKEKRILILTISMFLLFIVGFNIGPINEAVYNGNYGEPNEVVQDEESFIDEILSLSDSTPSIRGTGITLPIYGTSNASRLGENVYSWSPGTGKYESDQTFEFATPNNFWTSGTCSVDYKKAIFKAENIQDKNRNIIDKLEFDSSQSISNYSESIDTNSIDPDYMERSQETRGTGETFEGNDVAKLTIKSNNQGTTTNKLTTNYTSEVSYPHHHGTWQLYDHVAWGDSETCGYYTDVDLRSGHHSDIVNEVHNRLVGSDECHTNTDYLSGTMCDYELDEDEGSPIRLTSHVNFQLNTKVSGGVFDDGTVDFTGRTNVTIDVLYNFSVSENEAHPYDVSFSGSAYIGGVSRTYDGDLDSNEANVITNTRMIYVDLLKSGADVTGSSTLGDIYTVSVEGSTSISDPDDDIMDAIKANGAGEYALRVRMVNDLKVDTGGHIDTSGNDDWNWWNTNMYCEAGDFDLKITSEGPFPEGDVGFESDSVNFGGKSVSNDAALDFDIYVSDDVISAAGWSPTNTLTNAEVVIRVNTDKGSENSTKTLAYIQNCDGNIWSGGDTSETISSSILDGANEIWIEAFVRIKSDFAVHHGTGTTYPDPIILFHNITLTATIDYELHEMDFTVQLYDEYGDMDGHSYDITDTDHDGTEELFDEIDDFNIDQSTGFYFKSNYPGIEFDFDYTVIFTFETEITTEYIAYLNSTTKFNTEFSYNLSKLDLGYDEDYRDNLFFDLGLPNWSIWNLHNHNFDETPHIAIGTVQDHPSSPFYITDDIEEYGTQAYMIYIDKGSEFETDLGSQTGTQTMKFHNNIIDRFTTDPDQTWQLNFTMDTVISEITLSNKTAGDQILSNPMSGFYAGYDTINLYVDFTEELNEGGKSGAVFYNPSEIFQYASNQKSIKPNNDSMHFIGTGEGWDLDKEVDNLPDYYVWVNYTANKEDFTGLDLGNAGEKFKACFSQVNFSILHRSTYTIQISPNIYDTREHGINGETIDVIVNWTDENTEKSIETVDAKELILWRYSTSAGVKQHVIEKEPYFDMKETTEHNYSISFFPYFFRYDSYDPGTPDVDYYFIGDSNTEMGFGYYNFTINLEKEGYDSLKIKGDFNVLVDMHFVISHPGHSNTDDRAVKNPHYTGTAIMGEMFWVDLNLYYNQTIDGESYEDYRGFPVGELGMYYKQVEVNYTLYQIWENWTDTTWRGVVTKDKWHEVINWTTVNNNTYSKNPINGSFEYQGDKWTAEIQWPLPQYMKGCPKYELGKLYFIYNVSVRIKRSMNWSALGMANDDGGWNFQPNIVRNSSTLDVDSAGDNVKTSQPEHAMQEEPFRIKILNPEFGNATDLVLLNWEIDGDPFNMAGSTYRNETFDESHPERYHIVQYYHNNTENLNIPDDRPQNNSHDSTYNSFRLRVVFNCTSSGIGIVQRHFAPPVGLLNESNVFWGETLNWAGDTNIYLTGFNGTDIPLYPDEDHLFQYVANKTGPSPDFWNTDPLQVIDPAYGITYVTPWIFFNHSEAGTHTATIVARKEPGFIEARQKVTIEIKPQETEVRHSSGPNKDETYTPVTLIPPYGNVSYYDINYVDITNSETMGDLLISGAEINVITDHYKGEFVEGKGEHWSYFDFGNGTYRIYINNTKLPQDTGSTGLVRFQIEKDVISDKWNEPEYKQLIFDLFVKPRNRTLAVSVYLAGSKLKNIYTEAGNNMDYNLIYLTYELRDMDNKTDGIGKLLNDEACPHFKTGEPWDNLRLFWNTSGGNSRELDPDTGEGGDYRKTTKEDGPRYNFTFSTTVDWGPGFYTIKFELTGLEFYTDAINRTKIEILKPKLEILTSPINYRNETQFHPSLSYASKDDVPYYNIKLKDVNYSKLSGEESLIKVSGCKLRGNWSNPYYDDFNETTTNLIALSADYLFDKIGDDYTARIYFDIRNIDARAELYWNEINITKGAFYEIAYLNLSFRIVNSSTTFDKYQGSENEYQGSNIIFLKDVYVEEDISKLQYTSADQYLPDGLNKTEIAWGQWISIRFIYKADRSGDLGIGLSTTNKTLKAINWPVEWGAFAPIITYKSGGIYDIKFNLNVPAYGEAEGAFEIWISKNNFDPITFKFNLSTRDRLTSKTLHDVTQNLGIYNETSKSLEAEVTWSFNLQFGARFYDLDGDDYVRNGVVTHSNTDSNFTWSYTEAENGLYIMTVKTGNLSINKEYEVTFYLSKAHYIQQSFVIKFKVVPVKYKVVVEIEPDETFYPGEIEEITVKVQIFVNISDATNEKQVNVDYTIDGLEVLWEIRADNFVVKSGKFEWNEAEEKFIAVISTSVNGEPLTGEYSLIIIVKSEDPHFATFVSTEKDNKLVALGTGGIPAYFWVMLFGVIGAIAGIAGYGIRKAIYLSIPFVLRKIDETTKKIEKDKFPPVGVMTGRDEFIINSVINYLEDCGIEWEREDKFEAKKTSESMGKEKLPPLNVEQIEAELAKIPDIEADERILFIDELKRLDRDAQEEFLNSLRGEIKK